MRARELGFPLDQVRALLGLSGKHGLACEEVKMLTQQHLAEVRHKIRDLEKLKHVLADLSARCRPQRSAGVPNP
jgi:MerR family mercuric resistance operon transcriptional regulator